MKKLGLLLCVFFLGAVAATAQTWAVAVNTADAVELGTIGIEGSAAVGQHWSIHAGAKGQYQEFNRGGVLTETSQEGDAFGAGFAGGYSLMLKEHWNLDFGLGFWTGWMKYTTYACPECGRIVGRGDRPFVLPNEILLGLVYVF